MLANKKEAKWVGGRREVRVQKASYEYGLRPLGLCVFPIPEYRLEVNEPIFNTDCELLNHRLIHALRIQKEKNTCVIV